MSTEFDALTRQWTWTLVPHTQRDIIGCKRIFKIKTVLMVLCQLKTRPFANGNHHTKGLDYNDTFSPVAKQPTIRLVLSFAINYNWLICRLDVTSAFLQGFFF